MELKKIFSRKISIELVKLGNTLMYTEENHNKEGLKVFLFIETEKLLKDLSKLTNH